MVATLPDHARPVRPRRPGGRRRRRSSSRRAPTRRSRTRRASPAGFQCGQLAVPLDRTGAVPGTVTLSVKRVVASSNPTATAVVALAGGPGQAALPVATEFASILGPALADPRPAGLRPARHRQLGPAQLPGASTASSPRSSMPRRSAPTSSGRRAASTARRTRSTTSRRCASSRGYQKLVLFGVSYGTKVALDYAAKYPANVEALVLDSVVPPEGSDVLDVSTFKAMPRALRRALRRRRLPGITDERRPRPLQPRRTSCGASRSAARSYDARRPAR